MSKIQYVKARKEYKCSKCGCTISKGEKYYRGTRNFYNHPTIRCAKCGLKAYEMSSSEYIYRVGLLQDTWEESYTDVNMLEDIISELEDLKSCREENYNNIPEMLRDYCSSGDTLVEQIEKLDECLDALYDMETPDSDNLESEEWQNIKEGIREALEYL